MKSRRPHTPVEGNVQSGDQKQPAGRPTVHLRRWEWSFFVAVLALGLIGRLAYLDRSSIEHFDEGVYASNIWFDLELGGQYPMRYMYAPSLLPALIEWTIILTGRASGMAALMPSLVAGCVTIALIWWLARRWLSPAAALAVACLASFNDVHVMLSRAALTDVLLMLGWLMAAFLLTRAAETQRLGDALWAGLAVGLAWWTKYNGWLPLVIAAAAHVSHGLLIDPRTRFSFAACKPRLISLLLSTLTALAVWSPYWFSLQDHGGYAVVAANHRQYLVGFTGWWDSFTRQIANLQALDGTWGSVGWACACVAAWSWHGTMRQRVWSWRACAGAVLTAGLAFAAAEWLGASVLALALAAIALVVGWYLKQDLSRLSLGKWHCGVWFVAMLLLTPLYTPYFRLMLPWLTVAWLCSGRAVDYGAGWLVQMANDVESGAQRSRKMSWARIGATIITTGIVITIGMALRDWPGPTAWSDDRRGLSEISARIHAQLNRDADRSHAPAELDRVIYVYAEPALLFHLRAAGEEAVLPASRADLTPVMLQGRRVPTYLAVGLHAQASPGFRDEFSRVAANYELVGTFPYDVSRFVLLDHVDPRRVPLAKVTSDVRLYRLR